MTTAIEKQSEKYAQTGVGYEQRTYGDSHLRHYQAFRNDELARILTESFPDKRPLKILEVGCGTGAVLAALASLPEKHELFGVDASATMLSQAMNRVSSFDPAPKLQAASVDSIPFEANTFDVVLATRFIHLFSHEEKKRIFQVFNGLLRPGGISVVEFYSRPYHWLRYKLTKARNKNKEEFFSHYPTRKQVTDIIGEQFERRPLRLAGARMLHPLFRQKGMDTLTRYSEVPGIRIFVDEYFVVTRKS